MVSFLYRQLRPPPFCHSRPPACTAPPPSSTHPTQSRGKPRSQRSSVRTAQGMAAPHRTVLSRTYWSAPTQWNHPPICWDRMVAAFRRVIIPAAAARVLIPRCLFMSAQCLIGNRTEMISSRFMTNRLVWMCARLPCRLDPHRRTCPLRYRTSLNLRTVTS